MTEVFRTGPFIGVAVTDAFARAAASAPPVVVGLDTIAWPANLKPLPVPFGSYTAGEKITAAVSAKVDVLIVLYTEQETSALLDVFTGSKGWSPERARTWCGYGHNFAKFKPMIDGIDQDDGLKAGVFGYLSAVQIGTKTVALYKSDLHPQVNGNKLPFIPVLTQLITELAPTLVLSTGTAGAIGSVINCGDVAICDHSRFHLQYQYPDEPQINVMSTDGTQLSNSVAINRHYLDYAVNSLTPLTLPGLAGCYEAIQQLGNYAFVKKNTTAPAIYVTGSNPVPGINPMVIVSADYLTVDDNHDAEGLQTDGIMNDTDDAFLFYAIGQIKGPKPRWLSVRNASEPQIVTTPFPAGTPRAVIIDTLKGIAGKIYGTYQYCTTLNSAFACWGIIAGM